MKRPSIDSVVYTSIAVLVCLAGCGGESTESVEPSATDRALSELQAKYDEIAGDRFDDPVNWAAEDIENIGDWQYQVVDISFASPEQLEGELNALGDDRWEVFWMERSDSGFLVVLKKPAVSYLSKIPFSQIGGFVIGGGESTE